MPSSNVFALPTVADHPHVEVNETLVSSLEGLLAQARKGEIIGLGFVVQFAGNETGHGLDVPADFNYVALVGELRMLEYVLLASPPSTPSGR